MLQQSTEVSVMPLNRTSRADYYFGGDEAKTIQFNRVQAGELLNDIDSMEDELRRYYNSADVNNMIVEGIITDAPLTRKDKSMEAVSIRMQSRPMTLFSYRVAPSGFLHSEHAHNESAEKFFAWLYRLKEAGVATFFTHNYIGTARLLSSIYNNTQKNLSSHSTLNRYYIPRVSLGKEDTEGKRITIREQNPFIRSLMALSIIYKLDIGEAKATALYNAGYKSLYDLAFASIAELTRVEGFGEVTAGKLLSSIGAIQ